MENIKSILVIRLDKLGDLVLSLPAIESLKKNFPKARITALVNAPFGEMLLDYGFADSVIEFDASKNNGIAKKLGFLFSLGKERFDFAIDLQHAKNDFSALALLFANAGIKAGYAIGLRRLTANKPVGFAPEILPEKEHSLSLLRCLGLKTFKTASFRKNKKAEEKTLSFLKEHNAVGKMLIGVHAGVSGDIVEKAWQKERFAELAERLSKELGAMVFLTGTKKEDSLLDFIAKESKGNAIKANSFSINETIEFIRKTGLFVSNNTGPMHIAIMLGKPVIVLNAFSNPKRWLSKKNGVRMLVKKLACWPCETGKPINCKRGFECIRGISVREVFEAAKGIVKKSD